ncbi:hypothetical protein CON65_12615 [Bacillus pseudomycoides]|uniref:Uncharacterized protein n=1 Tax=Bacillus pseudomycoides TaxID=64104 RepID=A0AA91VBT9_9BACI|nr:hypothetical protein [Bacillus pseudomycoides]PED82320.1 hypothetical protein CON65_12615 [Bacillus pseudomycoides]
MAEITPVHGHGHNGHGHGQGHGDGHKSPNKKKKQMYFMFAAMGVMLLVILQKNKQSQPQTVETLQNTIPLSDSQRLDNFQSLVEGQLNSNITGAIKDLNTDWQMNMRDMNEHWNEKFKDLGDQLKDKTSSGGGGGGGYYIPDDSATRDMLQQQKDWVRDSLDQMKDNLGVGSIHNDRGPTWTIGKGTSGGENYGDQQNRFKNDRGALAEEIKRTQSVIDYRRNNGLDTSAQELHYKNLGQL